jgi:2-dehydro-3-deoxyphosphooctonate aldolase (KDO 8-P synthase)
MITAMPRSVPVKNISLNGRHIGNERPLLFIAGPCVIESRDFTIRVALRLREFARRFNVFFIFKASYDKANRSSVSSFRGPGLNEGLKILRLVKEKVGCPILTDVHSVEDVKRAAEVVDVLQIPAFLCRQTDLLKACGETGKLVNVKKGQFLAPWDMGNVIAKIEATGNSHILVTERGTSFGYNNLVVDMRSLSVLKQFGYPVIYDATHSVQLPGARGNVSGGQREYLLPLAKAAVSVGIAGVFTEVHPDPSRALSDGPNSLPLRDVPQFIKTLKVFDKAAKGVRV